MNISTQNRVDWKTVERIVNKNIVMMTLLEKVNFHSVYFESLFQAKAKFCREKLK